MPKIVNDHGLLMVGNQLLSHLFHFPGHGVYEPNLGMVDIKLEDADEHNRLLDQSIIQGLDENCKVGEWGTLYFEKKDGKKIVKTFTDVLVSDQVDNKKGVITFRRNGKVFRGRRKKDADCFNFKRIS